MSKDAKTPLIHFLIQRQALRLAADQDGESNHPDDVAARTTRILQGCADIYFQQLLAWKPQLKLRRYDRVKIIDHQSQFGYAAITCGSVPDQHGCLFPWIFYHANCEMTFGIGDMQFDEMSGKPGTTFFAIATTMNPDGSPGGRDWSKGRHGILFSTQDPGEAFERVFHLFNMKKLWNALNHLP